MNVNKALMSGSTALLVLHLISTNDMYGYQIIHELEARSNNVFSLKEGTLYPILHGLEKDGLTSSYTKIAKSGKKRKYYKITKKGNIMLSDKKQEWAVFSSSVNNVIGECSYAL